MAQHTLGLFRHLVANLPPLFPSATAEKMKNALEVLDSDPGVTPETVENTMIKFGHDLWPWLEAFRESAALVEAKLGEQFMLAHLPERMQKRYDEYRKYGLVWRDLYTGRAAGYFEPVERGELVGALVETKNDLHRFADREIVGLKKEKYLARVEELKKISEKIKAVLASLRQMAAAEQYHPTLAEEIRGRARSYELGLCCLAPNIGFEDVARSIEFFTERKTHLNMMRGIEKTVMVEF
ncbi:MAG: hypothetical protein PHD72_01910 [Patescibacteria group bacterium]|nr:hypothetical protein [Patescibacteria group bacterium]